MTRKKFIKLVELIGRGKRVEVVVSGTDLSYLWVVCGKGKCSLRGTQRQFLENICLENNLRSRILGTFVVKFLACLPLLGFSNV